VDLGEVYIWGAQLEEGTTATDYIPTGATVGGAPRFDHDPVTGESLGLLIEEERTNVVRYNSMSGAVPGVYGSGGSLPTGWSVAQQQPGTQLEIIGTGVERGIEYIDLRFFGTATSNQLWLVQPNGSTDIPVGTTDDWTSSVYGKVVAGDLSELNVATYSVVQGASGVVLKTGLTSEFTRLAGTGVSPSANRKARVAVGADQDQSYDVTMRLGGFQGERGEFATSFIPTNGSQVTRAADLASIQGSNFTDAGWFNQSEGTVFVQCGSFAELQSTEGRKIFQILESNATLHSISYRNNKKDDYTINTKVSGSRLFSPVEAGDPNHFDDKIGYAYSSTGGSVIHQGSAISSSTTDLSVIDADRLNLGTPSLNGHIKRFAYFPVRKTDQELIGLTGS